MPPKGARHMAYKVQDQGVAMVGFTQINQALQRIAGGRANFGIEYELQRRLRTIGETVAKAAPGNITHKTGRHGDDSGGRLEDSVKVSVTTRSASVYSTSVYGGVQNVGGGPHAGWKARGPHVKRASASQWMNKTVNSQKAFVEAELDGLLDWLVHEFETQ
jgi:hypothetical protein